MGNLNNFKSPPHKILTSYKERKNNSTFKKSGRHYLNQMIKVNIRRNRANQNLAPPDRVK